MPKDRPYTTQDIDSEEVEQAQSLLAAHEEYNPAPVRQRSPLPSRRQSSFSQPPENGAPRNPRTPNRVRFDIDEDLRIEHINGHAFVPASEELELLDADDSVNRSAGTERDGTGQRLPLLTNVEAPSMTVAADLDFDVDDLLESAGPKSGMRSTFMNMANSIMSDLHPPEPMCGIGIWRLI